MGLIFNKKIVKKCNLWDYKQYTYVLFTIDKVNYCGLKKKKEKKRGKRGEETWTWVSRLWSHNVMKCLRWTASEYIEKPNTTRPTHLVRDGNTGLKKPWNTNFFSTSWLVCHKREVTSVISEEKIEINA